MDPIMKEYLNKKRVIETVHTFLFWMFILLDAIRLWDTVLTTWKYCNHDMVKFLSAMFPEILILASILWGIFISRLILCAICDHVIEMSLIRVHMYDTKEKEQ